MNDWKVETTIVWIFFFFFFCDFGGNLASFGVKDKSVFLFQIFLLKKNLNEDGDDVAPVTAAAS